MKFLGRKAECLLFLAAGLVNALPVLLFKYFPSLDGAAHLYNSRLIHELLFGQAGSIHAYFSFTGFPLPNWLGHVLLTAILTVVPAYLAEKSLLLLYLLGLPYAFRYLVKTINPGRTAYSFLILPFCYSYLFTLGFYNFSLALIILFLTFALWIKADRRAPAVRTTVLIASLLILLYFAHIFVLGLTLGLLGLHALVSSVPRGAIDKGWLRGFLRSLVPRLVRLALVSALPLLGALAYFRWMPPAPYYTYIDRHELAEWLYTLRPIISYNMEIEGPWAGRIFLALALLPVASIAASLVLRKRVIAMDRMRLFIFLAASCCILGILYAVIPDGNGLAGYMSIRLALLLFLFALATIALFHTPKWIVGVVVLFVMYCTWQLDQYYVRVAKDQSKIAFSCEEAGRHVAPGSVVYPVDRSGNWMAGHYSNYLGVNEPMVILDNYEAGTGYFPLRWNITELSRLKLGDLPAAGLVPHAEAMGEGQAPRTIDHVFLLGDRAAFERDTSDAVVRETLSRYALVYADEHCALYGLRQSSTGHVERVPAKLPRETPAHTFIPGQP